jgi:hypothetical protein
MVGSPGIEYLSISGKPASLGQQQVLTSTLRRRGMNRKSTRSLMLRVWAKAIFMGMQVSSSAYLNPSSMRPRWLGLETTTSKPSVSKKVFHKGKYR